MEWIWVVLFIMAAIVGVWLWEKLVDGATDLLLRAVIWPFEKVFGVAKRSDAMRTFRTPQRFQLNVSPDSVGAALNQVSGIGSEPSTARIAPYYLGQHSGRVRVGVGNTITTPYELEIEFRRAGLALAVSCTTCAGMTTLPTTWTSIERFCTTSSQR